MDDLMRFPGAVRRSPEVDGWFLGATEPLRLMVRPWFERMRGRGPDVRELPHDGCPTACVGEAAFAYVNAFTAHAAVGFFQDAAAHGSDRLSWPIRKVSRCFKKRLGPSLPRG